ncbi:MAG: hypothetical protein M1834_002372 [Cirrosporium novae-zelandiae]|nr:MAG: hypothetical protein M1834_002372 [Cirrosporium novae-zelandiae]
MQSLRGKVAIVSGSSSGIGAAVARELSLRGANVVVNYPFVKDKEQADRVLATLQPDIESICVEADLSTLTGPATLAEAAVAKFGKIDILVNNAGRAMNLPMEEQGPEIWEQLVNLNGRGTLLLTQAVLKHLTHGSSRIVNVTSSNARDPHPGLTIYAGTKGMVDSFTRCWARELPPKYGCTVNSVAPGPVNTEAMANAEPEFKQFVQSLVKTTPVAPRLGEPSEIAWLIATLCEEKANWANGVSLVAGGGLYLG